MTNKDSHAASARQVDFHFRDFPGRSLDAKNLAVELAVVHGAELESGPDGSLSDPPNPHKTGKSRLFYCPRNARLMRHTSRSTGEGCRELARNP